MSAKVKVNDLLEEFASLTKVLLGALVQHAQSSSTVQSAEISANLATQTLNQLLECDTRLRLALEQVEQQRQTQLRIESLKVLLSTRDRLVGTKLFFKAHLAEDSLRRAIFASNLLQNSLKQAKTSPVNPQKVVSYACRISGSMSAPPPPPMGIPRDQASLLTTPLPMQQQMRKGLLITHGVTTLPSLSPIPQTVIPQQQNQTPQNNQKSSQQILQLTQTPQPLPTTQALQTPPGTNSPFT